MSQFAEKLMKETVTSMEQHGASDKLKEETIKVLQALRRVYDIEVQVFHNAPVLTGEYTDVYKLDIPMSEEDRFFTVKAKQGVWSGVTAWIIQCPQPDHMAAFKRRLKEAAASVTMFGLPEHFPDLTFHSALCLNTQPVTRRHMNVTPGLYVECHPKTARRTHKVDRNFIVIKSK